ncbi:bacterial Fmu (Sun)/eukaryotic nucleolar NOL1/Nop2p [Tanacetum coccineum]
MINRFLETQAWKDDGLTVFNGGCDKQVILTKNGTSVSSVARESIAHDQPILSSAWKDDGLTVFNGGCDKQVKIWDPGIKIVFRQHLEDKVVSEEDMCLSRFRIGARITLEGVPYPDTIRKGRIKLRLILIDNDVILEVVIKQAKEWRWAVAVYVKNDEVPYLSQVNGYDKVLVDTECTHDGSIKHIQKFENWGWTTLERRVLDAERTDDLTVLQVGLIYGE